MKMYIALFLLCFSALAEEASFKNVGFVTGISVDNDANIEFHTSTGTTYLISGLTGWRRISEVRFYSRNATMVALLQQSLAAHLPISIVAEKNNVSSILLDAAK